MAEDRDWLPCLRCRGWLLGNGPVTLLAWGEASRANSEGARADAVRFENFPSRHFVELDWVVLMNRLQKPILFAETALLSDRQSV